MQFKELPPAELLWELFEYNPLNGNLYWRVNLSNVKAGDIAGSRKKYWSICINSIFYSNHRIIWKWVTGKDPLQLQVDHRNRVKIDNSLKNLRLGNNSQNCANKVTKNKYGYTGVYKHHENSFKAQCTKDGVPHKRYGFKTPEEAALAYNELALKLHGEFALLNRLPTK